MSDRPSVTRVVKYIRKGVGISYTNVEYADSTSNSVAPTSGWKTTAPAWQNGHYIWQRVHIVYTDGTDGYSNPVCLSGGKGISKIEEYYLATSSASGVTRSTSGWTKPIQSVTAEKKYLWNYETVTYTDGSTADTDPVIIGVYGDTGVGISSVTEYYLATSASSGVTRSTTGWTTSIQTVTNAKKYLWNYETVTYTDGSTADTDPVIIGVYGDTGVGISSVTEYYLATSASSGVTRSTTGWNTSIQTVTNAKKYLWNYETVTYTDGSTADTDPVIIGVYGDTGVGISSVTEYYLATSASSGVTRSTTGWNTSIQTVTNAKKYLWNYETVTYTDGSTADTDPVIIGVYGDTGVGISSVTEYYLATSASSGVTRSTTGWNTSIQTVTNAKKYLWNYETVTYTDGSTADTDPVIIGVYGDTGVGISSVTEYYLATSASSGVTRSTTGWNTSIQTVTNAKKYLWNYETVTYTDGSTADTDPVIIGVYGDTGVGISSVTEYYLATSASSGVTRSTTGWNTSIQTVTNAKKYLWNYETVTYTDGSTADTDPVIIGVYGDTGVGISSVTEYYLATSASSGVTRSTTGWNTSIQTVTNAKKYLWNYETVTYTDGSTADTDPVIIGVYGDTGRGISSVTAYYLATSAASDVTTSTSGWTTRLQVMTETNCYLWNYEKITYTDGVTANTTPQIIGTYGKPGSQGSRGPALRGPQAWSDCTESGTVNYQFYAGKDGEPYLDIVLYNGNFYICTQSHTDKSILPTNTSYWALSDKVAMIAANVLFANHGFFGDAIISGSWLISANGKIDSTTYTKGQTFQSELAYNLFNANSPLGADITKHSSEGTTSINSTAATANRDTVYLEAGRVYYLTCTGYTDNASYPLYVRLQKTDGSITHTPVNLNSTSSVTRSGYVHITVSGNYYIQLYHATATDGFITSSKLVEKCFAPFYAVNLLSGKVYQTDAYVRGGLRSPFTYLGQGGTFSNDFSDNVAVYSASESTYALPWTTDQSGRKVVITNYYWNGNYSTATGYAKLTAPTGKYFYEDGVQKSTIKLSREAVELLGYGDTNSFYGWIVLKRIDLGTVSRYGHGMKMLAVGRVTGTQSDATISYHSFDGTTLSVSRDDTGVYTVSWNNNSWFANENSVFVMVCGYGVVSANNGPLYASVKTQTKTSITVQTADDDSRNDGSFSFFLMNFDDWIYLH